ncbi:MAG: LPS export ABC transporter periplasmic protein LptC [Candidatus Paracaedibacteraceae bacterium]|nr:LPS export ABC transporter periplasmic protein LptC [Candidatus Paracaedibacteraceae bacterium]
MSEPLMKNRLRIKRNVKYILPSCGVIVLICVFFGIAGRSNVANTLEILSTNYASNLKYGGQNKKGQPFFIHSERGKEVSDKEVVFENLNANIDVKKGEIMKIKANQGTFNKDSKNIDLNGDVQLSRSNGLILQTTEATINMESGLAYNNAPIEGSSDRAHIKANGFRIEAENQIVFLGQPELTIRVH